ncbi:hypothetical protein GCM10017687_26950 [Streptomyces echinatus]
MLMGARDARRAWARSVIVSTARLRAEWRVLRARATRGVGRIADPGGIPARQRREDEPYEGGAKLTTERRPSICTDRHPRPCTRPDGRTRVAMHDLHFGRYAYHKTGRADRLQALDSHALLRSASCSPQKIRD